LADVWRIGFSGGRSAALLVGGIRDYSDRLCKLVDSVPQRLVLSFVHAPQRETKFEKALIA